MSLRLTAHPSSVPTGRSWVMSVFEQRSQSPADVLADEDASRRVVELLTSELLTNAVTHGPEDGTVEIRAMRTARALRVEVRDESMALPVVQAVDVDATGGRGVGFVDMLSSEWGVIVDDTGKTVWFAVDLDDPSPLY